MRHQYQFNYVWVTFEKDFKTENNTV